MPLNLIVIALEGVSQTLFWQYRNTMPTLWRLSEKGIYFRRFYCNSTSAFQSFCDFTFGDSSELDHNLHYPSAKGCLLGRETNFFDILRNEGYSVLGMQHGSFCPDYVKNSYYGAWPDSCEPFSWHREYPSFFSESSSFLKKKSSEKKPFVLYLSDRVSTVLDNSSEKRGSALLHERFERGCALLDRTVTRIMEKLSELSLLDKTVVLVYGAYGMDPWKHAINIGSTHATEPYSDVCWTPMFLYNNGQDAKILDALACVIDLKPTILKLLMPEQSVIQRQSVFSGVNLLNSYRDVVFTQNMFALERENEGPARGLMKSYAATDGDQRLITTSNGGILGNGGMELYYDPRDASNTRNLLDFFILNEEGKLVSFGHNDATHPHFLHGFRPDKPEWLIKSVVDSYNAMREMLKRLVRTKEDEALPYCEKPEEAKRFDESLFNIKRNPV